jgi:hypothetical protein
MLSSAHPPLKLLETLGIPGAIPKMRVPERMYTWLPAFLMQIEIPVQERYNYRNLELKMAIPAKAR